MKRICFDIETNGLLHDWLDYSNYPFKFKEGFVIHCLCAEDLDTQEKYEFYGESIKDIPKFFEDVNYVVAHNGIAFDLRVLQVYFGMDFNIGPDTLLGHDCFINDTLVLSRLLNPDRKSGHSLKAWGKRTGVYKGDYAESTDWSEFSKEMLEYCHQDVSANVATWKALEKEIGEWDWDDAYELEKATQYITSIQEHFGFYFDTDLAEKNVKELDEWLREIEESVEPQLPPKPMGKTAAKGFIPPKTQFLKNGKPSHYIKKFVEKHEGEWLEEKVFKAYGKVFKLPLPQEPILSEEPMKLSNQQDLKKWLVSAGWVPRVWAETDLTLHTQKKFKLSREDYLKKVSKYVEETLGSPYEKFRCDRIGCKPYELKTKLLKHDTKRPLKAYTSPKYTINQDKDVDPALIKLGDKYNFINDVVKWLTYRHRRNSILSENGTGFLTTVRDDHRIPTPANTCGASTGRYQHKGVANIPRTTSLYGEPMRKLFGCNPINFQVGYDAAGLEARVEGHYTIQFKGGEDYAKALVADKPNDIHTVSAKKNGISRDEQKTLKYSCLPIDNTEVLTPQGWKKYGQLQEGMEVISYNTETGVLEKDILHKLHYYPDATVVDKGHARWSLESTLDHRWYGSQRHTTGKLEKTVRSFVEGFKTTGELNTEFSILNSASYTGESCEFSEWEVACLSWIVSDGHYKWSKDTRLTSSAGGTKRGVVGSIAQSENKFYKEVEEVLHNVGASYTKSSSEVLVYTLHAKWLRPFLIKMMGGAYSLKEYDWEQWFLKLSPKLREVFLYHFWLAEGCTKGKSWEDTRKIINQKGGRLKDGVKLCAYLCGYNVTETQWTIGFSKRPHTTCQRFKDKGTRVTDVFCITTTNSTFVIKQGGILTITGNCSYGAQAPKIASQMGWSLPRAKKVFESFWETALPLKILKERVVKYWKVKGDSKYVLGLDNRKLWARSQHSILNLVFQSAGAVICKRTNKLHWDSLKELGVLFDPFTDSSFNGKAMIMIMYHDECQWEISPELVEKWEFDSEDSAKEMLNKLLTEGKNGSNIDSHGKQHTVYYSIVGDLARKAMKDSGKYYNLRVPLDADYSVGKNWADCH